MLPVGQKRPQRRYECKRLIEKEMMMRLGNFDERRVSLQKLVHVLAGFGRNDDAQLSAKERNSAAGAGKIIMHRLEREIDEDPGVDFPCPSAVDFAHRRAGQVLHDECIFARLSRDQSKARKGLG